MTHPPSALDCGARTGFNCRGEKKEILLNLVHIRECIAERQYYLQAAPSAKAKASDHHLDEWDRRSIPRCYARVCTLAQDKIRRSGFTDFLSFLL